MGEITNITIEFLTTEKDCTLISSEITISQVFEIAKKHDVKIINPEGKKVERSYSSEKVHYIEY